MFVFPSISMGSSFLVQTPSPPHVTSLHFAPLRSSSPHPIDILHSTHSADGRTTVGRRTNGGTDWRTDSQTDRRRVGRLVGRTEDRMDGRSDVTSPHEEHSPAWNCHECCWRCRSWRWTNHCLLSHECMHIHSNVWTHLQAQIGYLGFYMLIYGSLGVTPN